MKTRILLIVMLLIGAPLLVGCGYRPRVGALRHESHSVELGNAKSVHAEINFGAGDLAVTGGADKLLEADFTYNVDKLKPEVVYTAGKLAVRQPGTKGLPIPRDIKDFRNEWGLRLYDGVPMDLSVIMGAGSSNLRLTGLSLTGLYVDLGAGKSTVDLSGDWSRNLDASIEIGAADITVRLPKDVGARVEVESGPHTIETTGLTQDGDVYTNAAYGTSAVTLQINVKAGIGRINLEVEE